jgi:hypothetical protein
MPAQPSDQPISRSACLPACRTPKAAKISSTHGRRPTPPTSPAIAFVLVRAGFDYLIDDGLAPRVTSNVQSRPGVLE